MFIKDRGSSKTGRGGSERNGNVHHLPAKKKEGKVHHQLDSTRGGLEEMGTKRRKIISSI